MVSWPTLFLFCRPKTLFLKKQKKTNHLEADDMSHIHLWQKKKKEAKKKLLTYFFYTMSPKTNLFFILAL